MFEIIACVWRNPSWNSDGKPSLEIKTDQI